MATTLDQVIAKVISQDTPLPSLEVSSEDRANAAIPAMAAMRWFRAKVQGVSPEHVTAFASDLRRISANTEAAKPSRVAGFGPLTRGFWTMIVNRKAPGSCPVCGAKFCFS